VSTKNLRVSKNELVQQKILFVSKNLLSQQKCLVRTQQKMLSKQNLPSQQRSADSAEYAVSAKFD